MWSEEVPSRPPQRDRFRFAGAIIGRRSYGKSAQGPRSSRFLSNRRARCCARRTAEPGQKTPPLYTDATKRQLKLTIFVEGRSCSEPAGGLSELSQTAGSEHQSSANRSEEVAVRWCRPPRGSLAPRSGQCGKLQASRVAMSAPRACVCAVTSICCVSNTSKLVNPPGGRRKEFRMIRGQTLPRR